MAIPTQPAHRASGSRDLEGGKLLAGLGAVLLIVSLFLDWYGTPARLIGAPGTDTAFTAWTAFELIDILLAALALATIAWALASVTRSVPIEIPASAGALAGPVALVLVIVSAINEPPPLSLLGPSREIGIWLALAGAALMTVGALLTTARISLVIASRDRSTHPPATPGTDPGGTQTYEPQAETQPLVDDPARRVRRG